MLGAKKVNGAKFQTETLPDLRNRLGSDGSAAAAASRTRRMKDVWRGPIPATLKLKPSRMGLRRSKRLKI
jgi:hypothetical protein